MKKIGLVVVGLVGVLAVAYFGWISYQKWVGKSSQLSVKVALKWIHQAQFAGNYMAVEKGFYQENGIVAELIPFDFKNNPIDQVASGSATFGVASADELLMARSKGVPVVAVAVIYQESPVVAYTLKSKGITTVEQSKGKRVGYENSDNIKMTIDNMILKAGLDPNNDIIRVPIGFDTQDLERDKVDVATGYITNEPLTLEEKGVEIVNIRPSKYGIQNYADVLFTSEENIEKRPELVKAFVRGTLLGWEYALRNQEETVKVTMKYVEDKSEANRKHQTMMLQTSESLIQQGEVQKVGQMSFVKWQRLYLEMKAAKLINNSLEIKAVYTLDFI